jgi:DNA-binding NarL/FixJ family response regulator
MKTSDPATTRIDAAKVVILADDQHRADLIRLTIGRTAFANAGIAIQPLKADLCFLEKPEPALIILDVQDVVVDPLQHIKKIKQAAPSSYIIMIVRESNAALAQRALRAGASAYLTGEESNRLLRLAIERVVSGERFVSEEVMQGILQGMGESNGHDERVPIEMLSDREMVIFQMIGQGKPFREIAGELGVNIKTVATHCNNIRRKIHSRDNQHLTHLCRRWIADRHPSRA